MSERLTRGDVVQPTPEAIALTRFRESSRLVIRLCTSNRWCVACSNARRAEVRARRESEGRPVYAHQLRKAAYEAPHLFAPGMLYAAGKELTSSLCLDHVDLVEGQR